MKEIELLKRENTKLRKALEGLVTAIDDKVNHGGGFPIQNTIDLMANAHAALQWKQYENTDTSQDKPRMEQSELGN